MRKHLAAYGVRLRPHVKTAKSIDVVRRAMQPGTAGITVSTLKEADYFLGHGIDDILYAVGIAPNKLPHAIRLIRAGADLKITLDSVTAAEAAHRAALAAGVVMQVLIEIDVDGHRAGVQPESDSLLQLGRSIAALSGLQLRGVMTHAGGSYDCKSSAAISMMATREREGVVTAAQRLRTLGCRIDVVSLGSTPTALFGTTFEGVTEVRAGVYMFNDLVMAGLGVCGLEDIAMSVLVSVIGHQSERGWILTDGGWMALSRDRGTAGHALDQAFGLVRDATGAAPADDLIVVSVNQEHGIIAKRDGGSIDTRAYPVGTTLRILPIHACATAAQYPAYVVTEDDAVVDSWERINGW